MVQNRTAKGEETPDAPLVIRYTSKVGNQSLIFNPTVALVLRRKGEMGGPSAWVTMGLFYRFTSILSLVYQSLKSDKLYHADGGIMYVDKHLANECSRKMSLFRNTVAFVPTIFTDRSGTNHKGIDVRIDGNSIGILHHNEALGLIEQLEHFDVTTYSLLAGVVDELESINSKVDVVLMKLSDMEKLLQNLSVQGKPAEPQPPADPFNWRPSDINNTWRM